MDDLNPRFRVNRRQAVLLGSAAGLVLASSTPRAASAAGAATDSEAGLPVQQIESILQGPGTVSNGVLSISLDRGDLGKVRSPLGVPFEGPFELGHDIYFQSLGNGRAILNGDVTLLEKEVNPFIDALLKNGLVFQALHQHYIGEQPQTWHIHFRGVGNPLDLARALHAAIKVTGTPLPQRPPSTSTPLNADELAKILGGDAQVEDGVVIVEVPRKNRIRLGGVTINPHLNVATTVQLKPLKGASQAAVGPDFLLVASEIDPVVGVMRKQGWFVGCLYNQETDEEPQLYFSHMLKVGNPYDLAREVRKALDLTNSQFTA